MINEPELFLWCNGQARRDQGIAKVSGNNGDWLKNCIAVTPRLFALVPIFTGEDIRWICEEAGLIPNHSNAWGALTNALLKRGIIKKTGLYRQMKDPRSHARETAVYTKA